MESINITSQAYQEMTINFGDDVIVLGVRFHSTISSWNIDVDYNGIRKESGVKLSVGVFHLFDLNLPFDFLVEDTLKEGIDPFKQDDFEKGRTILYLADREDMEDYRGYSVE